MGSNSNEFDLQLDCMQQQLMWDIISHYITSYHILVKVPDVDMLCLVILQEYWQLNILMSLKHHKSCSLTKNTKKINNNLPALCPPHLFIYLFFSLDRHPTYNLISCELHKKFLVTLRFLKKVLFFFFNGGGTHQWHCFFKVGSVVPSIPKLTDGHYFLCAQSQCQATKHQATFEFIFSQFYANEINQKSLERFLGPIMSSCSLIPFWCGTLQLVLSSD